MSDFAKTALAAAVGVAALGLLLELLGTNDIARRIQRGLG